MRHTFCFFVSLCVCSAMTAVPVQASPPSPSPVTPPSSAEPAVTPANPVTPATPAAPVVPAADPAGTVVPAPVAPAAPAAASPAVSDAAKDAEEKLIKRLRSQGYRPKVQNGQTVFCKKEAKMNSRFEVEYCASAEALDITSRNAKDAVADMQRRGNRTPQSN